MFADILCLRDAIALRVAGLILTSVPQGRTMAIPNK